MMILRLLIAVAAAFLMGKLVSKVRLPAILGWLLTGMILGPYAVGVVNDTLLNASWYRIFLSVLECGVGLMIGTELVFKELKKSGKQILLTTLAQSLWTFVVVTLCFGVIFYFTGVPLYLTLAIMILLPIVIGIVVGLLAGFVLKKSSPNKTTLILLVALILLVSSVGFVFNYFILPEPVLNFMLIGMAFSATFANMVSGERLLHIMDVFNPILGFSMIIVILNLGAPLDYHLILGAGIFTAIYIISRALGKYTGAYWGAKATGLPKTVQKYLGLTLLPHSGVSLVFTGIAVTSLNTFDPKSALIIQGTIAAAAVINEVIAVIVSRKAFEWAGEFGKMAD